MTRGKGKNMKRRVKKKMGVNEKIPRKTFVHPKLDIIKSRLQVWRTIEAGR